MLTCPIGFILLPTHIQIHEANVGQVVYLQRIGNRRLAIAEQTANLPHTESGEPQKHQQAKPINQPAGQQHASYQPLLVKLEP